MAAGEGEDWPAAEGGALMVRYYCDRCKEERVLIATITIEAGGEQKVLDLCRACVRDTDRFVHEAPPTMAPRKVRADGS